MTNSGVLRTAVSISLTLKNSEWTEESFEEAELTARI